VANIVLIFPVVLQSLMLSSFISVSDNGVKLIILLLLCYIVTTVAGQFDVYGTSQNMLIVKYLNILAILYM